MLTSNPIQPEHRYKARQRWKMKSGGGKDGRIRSEINELEYIYRRSSTDGTDGTGGTDVRYRQYSISGPGVNHWGIDAEVLLTRSRAIARKKSEDRRTGWEGR